MKIHFKNADKFAAQLIKKGYNKRDLAKGIDMSYTSIIGMFKGRSFPSPRAAKAICEFMDVKFDDIFVIKPKEG